jgi:hypothetical protein
MATTTALRRYQQYLIAAMAAPTRRGRRRPRGRPYQFIRSTIE